MPDRVVAIVGTRYEHLAIEEAALAPLGVALRSSAGTDADALVREAGDAELILAGSAPRFDAAVLDGLSCRGIVRYGVGVDAIDLDAARERGIWVANVVEYGTEAVAIHAVTLALAGIRRLREADARIRAGEWGFAPLRPLHLPSTMTAGVVGHGRIGRAAADLLAGLGFHVLVHDAFAPPQPRRGVAPAPLEDLLSSADVVTLHAPGPADGRPLLGGAELARMKPGSVLVNTARGSLVDVPALVEGLRAGRPRIAALDVFPGEPPALDAFADVLDRVVLTPHMAWYTEESEHSQRTQAAEAARRLLLGERPEHVVVEGAALNGTAA